MKRNARKRRQRRSEQARSLSPAEFRDRYVDQWPAEYRSRLGESVQLAIEFQRDKVRELLELGVDETTISDFIAACASGAVPAHLVSRYEPTEEGRAWTGEAKLAGLERRWRRHVLTAPDGTLLPKVLRS